MTLNNNPTDQELISEFFARDKSRFCKNAESLLLTLPEKEESEFNKDLKKLKYLFHSDRSPIQYKPFCEKMIRELNDLYYQSDSVYVKSPLIREALALYAKYYINHKQYKASYVAASILIIAATAMSISFNMIWPMIIAWPFVAMLWRKGLLMYTNSQAPEQPSMSTDLNGSGGEFSTRTPSGTIAFLQIDGPNR